MIQLLQDTETCSQESFFLSLPNLQSLNQIWLDLNHFMKLFFTLGKVVSSSS